MPYNKGDFTQQGVNGVVTALVRLNDKRVVKMALSSDDESSNVNVVGTVYDYLNGETYPLGGSTPTGTITITENTEPGSPLDIAQYRYADVSVSGVDLLYCDIIIHNSDTSSQALSGDDVSITFAGNTIENNAITQWNGDSPTDEIAIGESITYRLYYNNTPVPILPAIEVTYPESSTEVTVDTSTNLTLTTADNTNSYVPTDAAENSLLELTIYKGLI